MDPKLLQKIRDKLLGVTESAVGGLNTSIYLQQIRDAVLGVTREAHGNLNEVIYLQQIRNAIKGVPDGQFGSLAASVYLQEIRDAFNSVTSNPVGSMDEDLYLGEIYPIASINPPTVTITSTESSPTAANPIPVTITFSESVTGFEVGDLTVGGGSAGNFAGSGAVYTADITPDGNAAITVDIAAGVCTDVAGNGNTAATQFAIGIIVTLTYQPDNTTGQDTYTDSGIPDTDVGAVGNFRVNNAGRIGLIKFPISLGANPSIQSGVISLWNDAVVAFNLTITLRRILPANSGWTESSTWNYKTPSTVRWAGDAASDGGADAGCSQSGVDYSATALGSFLYTANDPAGTKYDANLDLSELILMCSANHGFTVRGSAANTLNLRSCEAGAPGLGHHPKLVLVVHYLP